ncbi:MAG: hypothetical protein R3F56_06725 [Planctomycetota bacterium]
MRSPLPILLALVASAPALRADRFYFGSEVEDKKFVGEEGTDVRSGLPGVLLREQDGMYVIRVEGGEVWVERSRVYHVEKDDLTVAQIEERERKAQDLLAAARGRHLAQVAEAAAKRSEQSATAASKAEGSETKALTLEIDFEGLLPGYKFLPDSDVLRRVDLVGLSREIEDWLRANGVEPARDAKRDFTVHVDFKGLLPAYGFKIYDPVVHRVDLRGLARQVEDYLRAEVEAAANRTKRKISVH